MGYTPAFDTLYTGTLCGRWPEAAVMASLLPLVDSSGEINMSYQAIHALTGWPLDLLEQGIRQLMEPDPYSRSPDNEGRRLVLIEPTRPWGWKLVNHAKYREKARLAAKSAREVESGKNAARLRADQAETAGDRRSPPETAAERLSNTNTNTHKKRANARGCRVPEPFEISDDMRQWAAANTPHVLNLELATEQFVDYWRGVSGQKGVKVDWVGTWRNRLRDLESWSAKSNGNGDGWR